MRRRLYRAGIFDMAALLATAPRQMRNLWGNVTGERLWYALHGYDIQTPPSERGMYGHGRVLPPDYRSLEEAKAASRLLLVKAARRMRRDGWNAGRLWLWLSMKDDSWGGAHWLPAVRDDQAVLSALEQLWRDAYEALPSQARIKQVHVTLLDLTPIRERQLDMLLDDALIRKKWQAATEALDRINTKYSRTLVSLGPWSPPPGGYAGGKISYTRIPDAEDFW